MAKRGSGQGGSESGGIRLIADKLDEIVAKAIPEQWLATAFAGAAVVALILFILMIIGFARSPEEAAQAKREAAETALAKEKESHGKTSVALSGARADAKKAEKKAGVAESRAARAEGKVEAANTARKKLDSEIATLNKQVGAERGSKQTLERQIKTTKDEANRVKTKAEAARDRALKDASTLSERAKKLDADLAALRKQHEELRAATEEAAKMAERARLAFEEITKAVSEAKDKKPEERIDTIESMREASRASLEGTRYMVRLDSMIAREKRLIEEGKLAAAKEVKREDREIYEEVMLQLKVKMEHDAATALLGEAKEKVSGTVYKVRIQQEIDRRETAYKNEVASAVYKEVMKEVNAAPKAYEENLKALEDALGQIEGTSYGARLERMIGKRRKTLKTNVALAAYREVEARIKSRPEEYDENIAAVEDALLKTEGTRYEASLRKRLISLKKEQLEKLGREAYDAARAQLRESPKNYAGNVAVLRELKTKAEGSSWEPRIAKMLTDQERRLARSSR